jgi:hypothetical protein
MSKHGPDSNGTDKMWEFTASERLRADDSGDKKISWEKEQREPNRRKQLQRTT